MSVNQGKEHTMSNNETAPTCAPCAAGEHADDGTGTPCPCCGAEVSSDD